MVKKFNISVVTPVFEQWDILNIFIKRLSHQITVPNRELIIIDNGSNFIPTLKHQENLRLLNCEKPGSYAARNLGISMSNQDLIVFTDADCLPAKDWLETIEKAYQCSDGKTLLAGNVVIRSESNKPSTAELYDISAGLPQERYVSQGYAVTANLAIPRVVFDEIGLFDEQRFSGGDAEFCQRAIKAGFNLEFVSDAVIYHPARKTWREWATKVRRMKGGQIKAGKLSRRLKYFLITLIPPIWRIWRTAKSDKLRPFEKMRVAWFQVRLWLVELAEMVALLFGKTPERR